MRIALIVLFLFGLTMGAMIKFYSDNPALTVNYSADLAALNGDSGELQRLNKIIVDAGKKDKYLISHVIVIANDLPAGVKLTMLKIDENEAVIEGFTSNARLASVFTDRILSQNDYFDNAVLEKIDSDEKHIKTFYIKAQLK